uniref:Apple domain-containing protein n=1 Tax=Setaria digitata TaxID=48799 RepID=A0A915PU30_9BILA
MDGSMLRMDKNEVMTTGIQEDSARNSLQNVVKVSSFKGATAECSGRIEFEISRIDDLSSLNISSKVSTQSPAACAMKCYETANCVLAAYVPSRNDESTKATCMLTSNSECDYTISAVTELTRIRQAEVVEPALSVGQCAEICWRYNCTVSQYDYKSNLCSLTSIKGQDDCPKEMPIAVESDELVLLKCVRCFT